MFDCEAYAQAHGKQLQLNFEAKSKKLGQKPFNIDSFKRTHAKMYKIARKKACQEFADLAKGIQISNLDEIIQTQIEGHCKLYFDCMIAQSNTHFEALAMVKKLFDLT